MDILNQFGINPILLAAQVVNFLVLLFILKKLLYGPILKVLAQRRKTIEDSLKNAQEIELKLQETNEKIDKMMARASEEIQQMMSDGQKMRDQILDEAHQKSARDVEEILRKGKEAAKADTERLEQEMMGRIAEIVAKGMEKVTGKMLNKKDQIQLVEREIKNLS